MTRFLRLAAIIGAIVFASADAVQAQQIILKLHHFVPPCSTAHVKLLLPWVERVEKESGGRIKIQIYPAMQLGGSMSQLLDQVATALSILPERCPAPVPVAIGRIVETRSGWRRDALGNCA